MERIRPISELIAEIMTNLREVQERYEADCGDAILSCRAAANYIGRSPGTISRYLAEGRLKKVCVKGVVGIRKSELERLRR